jgi:L-ascorbate metabolism protein UlaG (beta-lactamase superfamily)
MKISFVGHASILVDVGGVTILSDPWWRGPCFGAQWWTYPAPVLDVVIDKKIDFIYVSHGHHDHLHPGTLQTLSRDAKVLIARGSGLALSIRAMGFTVIELGDEEFSLDAEGATCRIMPTHSGDTLMAISDGHEVCININDALHSTSKAIQSAFVNKLKTLYPLIDYVFCGYGTASHFPNCYVIPGKNREATAAHRQHYFNRQWAMLIEQLQPRFGFPFAADVVFLEDDLFWLNEPVHNCERPTDAFHSLYPASHIMTLDIAPGFAISDGVVSKKCFRHALVQAELKTALSEQIARANRHGSVSATALEAVAGLLENAIQVSKEYLVSYPDDYRFLIRFHNSDAGILIEKKAKNIHLLLLRMESGRVPAHDVMYTTRLAYLKRSLTQRYGDEILFVGSGGIFEYDNRAKASQNLHREFQFFLKKRAQSPAPRHPNCWVPVFKAKQAIKKLLRPDPDPDMYDLATWTVFDND